MPGPGAVAAAYAEFARVTTLDYEALTLPRDPLGAWRGARRASLESGRFRDLIRERRPQLAVISSAMLPATLVAARRENVPAIVYAGELFRDAGAGRSSAGGAVKGLGGRALTRLTGAFADAVLACSRTVAAQYERARRARVSVLYPPIPDHSGGDALAYRSRLGIGSAEPVLVAIGNITRNRGQDVLIAALPAIRARVPGARAVIVGDPHPRPQDLAFRDSLSGLAERLGVADAVSFAAHEEDVADVLAAADVVVNPRRSGEAFGRVACEALVAGRPVVAMREGAVPEVLRHGETALLVTPDDSAALAEAAVRAARGRRPPWPPRGRGPARRAAPVCARAQPGGVQSCRGGGCGSSGGRRALSAATSAARSRLASRPSARLAAIRSRRFSRWASHARRSRAAP